MSQIVASGGAASAVASCAALAEDFRRRIVESGLPFEMRLVSPSNAVTYIDCPDVSAKALFTLLKDEYGIWLCRTEAPRRILRSALGILGTTLCPTMLF